MNPADTTRTKQLVTAFAVLLAIVIIVAATVVASRNKTDDAESTAGSTNTQSSDTSTTQESAAPGTSTQSGSASGYKDGTYSADATYQSPGGTEAISVRLTITDGKVTSSTVTTEPTDKEAAEYQNMFKSGYKSQITGKSIDDISLSRVSGSSLTSEGFNSAVNQIKQQAQS